MTRLFFLSGLPRSGSTLLASIMNQHPQIYVSGTSPLMDLLCLTDQSIGTLRKQYSFSTTQEFRIHDGLLNSFYAHVEKPIVFDKHRGWPRNAPNLSRYIKNPRIVCTIRPVAEVITSYIILVLRNPHENFVDDRLKQKKLSLTIENRAKLLWEEYIQDPYQSTLAGLQTNRENMLLVSYADIVSKPDHVLHSICEFIGCDANIKYDFFDIRNTNPEKDVEGWGMPGLHTVRPMLKSISKHPEDVIGPLLTSYFEQFDLVP